MPATLRQRRGRLAGGVAEHGEIDVEHALDRGARGGGRKRTCKTMRLAE